MILSWINIIMLINVLMLIKSIQYFLSSIFHESVWFLDDLQIHNVANMEYCIHNMTSAIIMRNVMYLRCNMPVILVMVVSLGSCNKLGCIQWKTGPRINRKRQYHYMEKFISDRHPAKIKITWRPSIIQYSNLYHFRCHIFGLSHTVVYDNATTSIEC